jgi:hypothetical protein
VRGEDDLTAESAESDAEDAERNEGREE